MRQGIDTSSETGFFYSLQPHLILDAIEALGYRCTGRSIALNSMENRVYEIELDLDDRSIKSPSEKFLVAKFYRPGRWTKEQILDEHRFILDCVNNEIPVVAPIADSKGETLQEMKEAKIFFAVFPKQGGRIEQELDETALARMGRLIARLHAVGAVREAPNRLRINPETYGRQNIEFLNISGLIPEDFREPYFRYAELLLNYITPMFNGIKVQRIHGDCHAGNVLWGSNGPTLVDFDDMLVGPPVQDIWLLIPSRDRVAKESQEIFLSGYEILKPFDRSTLNLIEALRTLRIIHFAAWIARRWEDPSFKTFFSYFGTNQYWREQIEILAEQWEVLQGVNV